MDDAIRERKMQELSSKGFHVQGFRVKIGLSCVIGSLGRQEPAATLRQQCPRLEGAVTMPWYAQVLIHLHFSTLFQSFTCI